MLFESGVLLSFLFVVLIIESILIILSMIIDLCIFPCSSISFNFHAFWHYFMHNYWRLSAIDEFNPLSLRNNLIYLR